MLSCRDIVDKADEYHNHNLHGMQRFQYLIHTVLCRHCRRFVKQYQILLKSLHCFRWKITTDEVTQVFQAVKHAVKSKGDNHE